MGPEKQFRIPTVLALSVIALFVAILVTFSDDAQILLGRAQQPPTILPSTVSIFNTNDNETIVFWESREPVASTLVLPSSSVKTRYDVRDSDNIPKQYTLHIFSLSDLLKDSDTNYEIKIANRTVYRGIIPEKPALSQQPQVLPIYGSYPEELIPERGVFIIVSLADKVETAIFSSSNRPWVLPLATIRTKDLTSYFCENNNCSDETPIKLTFLTEGKRLEKNATIGTSRPFSDTDVLSYETETQYSESLPLPIDINPQINSPSQTSTPTIKIIEITPTPTLSQSVLSIESKEIETFSILNPKEGATFSFVKPLFRGEGFAGKEVIVTISGSITQIGKTRVSDKHIWQWTPGYPLSSGNYSLKVESVDNNNKKITLSRSFAVLKSGESVLSASTPSATIIPTYTPIDTPTTIPSPTPTLFQTAGPALSILFIGGGSLLLLLALTLL